MDRRGSRSRRREPRRRSISLSGGNQQKVMFGKALRLTPKLLLLDEPTQGIDIGAKDQIHRLVDIASAEGVAIVVASTDTDELVRLCHRVVVMANGHVTATLDRWPDPDRTNRTHPTRRAPGGRHDQSSAFRQVQRALPVGALHDRLHDHAGERVPQLDLVQAGPDRPSGVHRLPGARLPRAARHRHLRPVDRRQHVDGARHHGDAVAATTRCPTSRRCSSRLCACGVAGFISGFFVVRLRVNSFIATLGMSQVITAFVLQDVEPVDQRRVHRRLPEHRPSRGVRPAAVHVLPRPILAIIVWYVFEHTPVGRHMFATGGNPEAARLAGLRTDRLIWGSLVASGMIAGFAGIIYGWKVGNYAQTVGPGYLFPAIAAVFFGASQLKGRPNVWGTFIALYALAWGIKGLQLTFTSNSRWIEPLFQGLSLLGRRVAGQSPGVVKVRKSKEAAAEEPARRPDATDRATSPSIPAETRAVTDVRGDRRHAASSRTSTARAARRIAVRRLRHARLPGPGDLPALWRGDGRDRAARDRHGVELHRAAHPPEAAVRRPRRFRAVRRRLRRPRAGARRVPPRGQARSTSGGSASRSSSPPAPPAPTARCGRSGSCPSTGGPA